MTKEPTTTTTTRRPTTTTKIKITNSTTRTTTTTTIYQAGKQDRCKMKKCSFSNVVKMVLFYLSKKFFKQKIIS